MPWQDFRDSMSRHIFLTGSPGIGKTTVIEQIAQALTGYHPDGFVTREIRDDKNVRKGFELVTLEARHQVLAHISLPGPFRVGRYGVDHKGFDALPKTIDLTHSPSRVVILDEIGKMECLSHRFIQEVEALLDSSKLVVATVAFKGGGFPCKVKQRAGCRVVTLTLTNRSTLPGTLVPDVVALLSCMQPEI
jgi:nucleoside-triphosphatase